MSQADENFDPQTVPHYPVVKIRTETRPDGSLIGFVDDRAVKAGDAETVRLAVLDDAAARAKFRPLKAIRVSAVDSDGNSWPMVVTAEGELYDLSQPSPGWRTDRKAAKVGLVLLVVLLALALTAASWFAIRNLRGQSPPDSSAPSVTPTAEPTELPALAPNGWSSHALWSSPLISPQAQQDLASIEVVDDNLVTTVIDGSTHHVVGIDSQTGQPIWGAPLDAAPVSGPAVSRVGGQQVIAVATNSSIALFDLTGAPLNSFELVSGTEPVISETGVFVIVNDHQAQILVDTETLVERVIPAGGAPIAVYGKRLIVASPTGEVWQIDDPQTAPDPLNLLAPSENSQPAGFVGQAGETLLFGWLSQSGDHQSLQLAGHRVTDFKQLFVTELADTSTFDQTWLASPDGSWGIFGRTLVDIENETTHDLGEGWATVTVLDETAWANPTGASLLMATRDGQTQQQTGHVAIAIPVAERGSNELVVVAQDAEGFRLYGLETE